MKSAVNIYSGSAALVVVSLSFIFFFINDNRSELNDRVTTLLYQIAYKDSLLRQEVIKLKENHLSSFDDVKKAMQNLDAGVSEISREFKDAGLLERTVEAISNFEKMATERNELVEDFISKTAILNNAVAVLPELLESIHNMEHEVSGKQNSLHQLQSLIVEHISSPKESLKVEIHRELNLRTPVFQRLKKEFVSNQFRILVDTLDSQQVYANDILKIRTDLALAQLQQSYASVYGDLTRRAAVLRWALFLLCLVLVPMVAITMSAQAKLNSSLEEKISERTNDLLTANRNLVAEIEMREKTQIEKEDIHKQLLHSSKLAAIGEMAGGIAHEINNPLAIIDMRARQIDKFLHLDPLPVAKLLEYNRSVISTAERMAKIVLSMRTISRKNTDDPLVETKLDAVIIESIAMCKDRLSSKGINIEYEPNSEDFVVLCRPLQVSQVLVNLLNNAHDAIAHLSTKLWIRISTRRSLESIEIVVTDCGSGISADVEAKIFQPFFTTKASGVGTGLGLSVSQSIMKAFNGDLYLDRQATNTTFVLKFPLPKLANKAS